MYLPRGTRKYGQITLTATLADGGTATIDTIDVALTPRGGSGPGPGTPWITGVPYDDGAEVLFAHPDVPTEGAVTVPAGGADVFARVTDTPEVDVACVGSIDVA